MININTERLIVRPFQPADAEFIIELLNEPDFHRYIGDKQVRTEDDALAYIVNGPQKSFQQHGFGLMLVSLHNGTKLGMCGLLKRAELTHPDLGFAFLAQHYRQGYAFEAAQAVLQHHNISTVLAITDPANQPSQALLLKLGFNFVQEQRLSIGLCRLFQLGAVDLSR